MVVAVPVLSAVGWILIAAMVGTNPSGTLEAGAAQLVVGAVGVAGGAVAFLLPAGLLKWARSSTELPRGSSLSRRNAVSSSIVASLLLLIAMAAVAATWIHRDFHSYYAQVILLHGTLFLLTFDSLFSVRNKEIVYRLLFYAAAIVFGLMIVWLMLMSYAIVVRVEPRWIEATGYNVVNALIVFLFIGSAASLRERAKRVVRLETGRVLVEGKDVSSILTSQERQLLAAFLASPGVSWNCKELSLVLAGKTGVDRVLGKELARCKECMANSWSPSKCSHYKNIKNRINDAKKYLELLGVGTIVPATAELRRIKEAGWRLRIFDDVRVLDRRETRENAHVRL